VSDAAMDSLAKITNEAPPQTDEMYFVSPRHIA
jgi:hypothetical protein